MFKTGKETSIMPAFCFKNELKTADQHLSLKLLFHVPDKSITDQHKNKFGCLSNPLWYAKYIHTHHYHQRDGIKHLNETPVTGE